MAILDHQGRVIHLTPSFTHLLGYSREDLPHIDAWWSLAYPDPAYRQEIRAIWERDLASNRAGGLSRHTGEALIRCKDGRSLWVEGHARFCEREIIVLMVDVSDRKRMELEAQRWAHAAEVAERQAAWLHLALEATHAGVWEWEIATDTHYWSPGCWRLLYGLEGAESGQEGEGEPRKPDLSRWEALIHPDDRPGLMMAIATAVAEGRDFQAEFRLQRGDGLRWLLVRGAPIAPEGPRPLRYLGVLMDVTASHQLAQRLREAEERWTFALQGAGLGVWDWNIDTGEVFWSRDWLGMLGYEEGALKPTPEVWRDLLHPDDWERIFAYAQNFLADPGGRYEQEFRLRHQRGHWVDILSRATLARDAAGQVITPRRLVGTHLDITERKALQRSIHLAGQRYQAMRESSPDGFCVVSPQGRILEVNDTYCRQSGYSRAEFETLSIPDLEGMETREQTQAHLRLILERGADRFETRQRRKDGQIWHVEVSASYSPLEGGCFFCFLHDISARKRAQRLAELRQHLLELLPLGNQDELLRTALDVAEELTHSQIGFLHFVAPDQREVSLQVWSSHTLAEMCFAEGKGRHYPISQAGVWVDCIHQRRPVIHNDYAALPHRKGLPEGHAPVRREATVPLILKDQVLAVIGVGNKACDYTDEDVEVLRQVLGMAMDFAERHKVGQRLEYVAYYDPLTGLPNRTLVTDRLGQALALASRSRQLVGICYLNLDGFKPINDDYGRQTGDAVLVRLGQRLQGALRQGDSVARVGGDEFAFILTGLNSSHEGEEAARRILGVISEPFKYAGHRLHLSASLGLTLSPLDPSGPDALLHHAHQAMYQAKSDRKGAVHLFDPVQDQQERLRRQIRQEFAQALRLDQLQLHYQPKVALRDGHVIGMEALLRWPHPRDGLLAPSQFLPLIKDTPLEIALDEWVLVSALAQRQAWREAGWDLAVSVNLSPRHIQMPDLTAFLTRTLARFPPGTAEGLEIEILEQAAIEDTGAAAEVMRACKALGCRFSLDDFGTGYASLSYFQQLPVDILKIDMRFVRHLLANPDDLAIVEGVLRLARALDRPVLAEGVELLEIGLLLYQLGCDFGQGFGIARPMPAAEVPAWLGRWNGDRRWQELPEAVATGVDSPHLNVALFSLRRWARELGAYLRGEEGAMAPTLDEYACQFCHWYQGIGKARYGDRPSYPFIQAAHHRLHVLAANMVDKLDNGQSPGVQEQLGEFEQHVMELVELLRTFET